MSSNPLALPEPVEQSPKAPTIYIIVVIALAALGVLTVVGGVIFTLGTIFHHRDHWPFSRAIWHGHVLAASATHYAAVIMVAGLS